MNNKYEYIECALKSVYLSVFQNNVRNNHPILQQIRETTNNVWGAEIIRIEQLEDIQEYREIHKPLKRVDTQIIIPISQLNKIKDNMTLLCSVFNSLFEDAIENACSILLKNLCEEIRNDCEIDFSDDVIVNVLRKLDYSDLQQIELNELCDWVFYNNNDNTSIITLKEKEDTAVITLIKYCNFTLTTNTIHKIRKMLYLE